MSAPERYVVILPCADDLCVLLLPGPNGWMLPEVTMMSAGLWAASALAPELRRVYGLTATVRREVAVQAPPLAPVLTFIYLIENHDPVWQPPAGARWVARDELNALPLAYPEQWPVLAEWFAWEADDGNPLRVGWFRRGWYRRAVGWIERALAVVGRRPAGPPEQLRSWQRSIVLRQPTDQGDVYFKAVPPFFAHEPPLTALLHERFPVDTPNVLARHETEPWMLMEDAGSKTLADLPDMALYEQALSLYAQMQIEEAAHVPELLALGVPDRRLDVMVAEMDELLADTAAMFPDEPRGLSGVQIGQLQALAPRLKAMCGELAASDLPETLEHGDLWARQIAVREGRPIIMDWSDATIAYPFFSPGFFTALDDPIFLEVEVAGRYLAGRLAEARERFLRAYLEPWTCYAPPEQLGRVYELAQALAGLHYALLYHRRILPGMECRWEMENMLPWHLRKALARCAAWIG